MSSDITRMRLKTRLTLRDMVAECLAVMANRPLRTTLTALGTVLGTAALVGTVGLAQTASEQIAVHFDELAATEVRIRPARGSLVQDPVPFDAEVRLARLNGVVAVGTVTTISEGVGDVRRLPDLDLDAPGPSVSLVAASPGLFEVVRAEVESGRAFDAGHADRLDAVAVLGVGAAERLALGSVRGQPALLVRGEPVTVIGIIADVRRESRLLNAVIVTDAYAAEHLGLGSPSEVVIETEIGAASLLARQASIALNPNAPDGLEVLVPPEPRAVRAAVDNDLRSLLLFLGTVSMVIGGVGIANVTLVSVMERRAEIGLRRALGARGSHIARQFMAESGLAGLLGGIIGVCLGLIAVLAGSFIKEWTPVISPWVPGTAAVAGLGIGLLAGVYPAYRAAKVEPADALRG